jgi:hypothetical protein
MSLTVLLAFPHGDSKGEDLFREDMRCLDFAGGILVEPAMRLPRFPVAMPLGSIYCRGANRFPRSVSKTLYLSQLGTVASVHFWLPGSGKAVSNNERRLMSESADVKKKLLVFFEGRDTIHHILHSRYMDCHETTCLGTVQHEARPRRRRLAVGDLDFECVHPAECQAVCVWISFALATTARTSAASSKSEFVSRPLGVSTKILPWQCPLLEECRHKGKTIPPSAHCDSLHDGEHPVLAP